MNKQIWRSLMTLIDSTSYFDILVKKNFKKDSSLIDKLKQDFFPMPIIDFYETMNGFLLKWRFNEDLVGGVNFLPAEHLYDETQQDLNQIGVDWFIDEKRTEIDGSYHPVDLITDEASVGFFSTMESGELYYYDAGAVFYSLNVDIIGYCKLLDHTYGLLRWPRLLVGLRNNAFQDTVAHFVTNLQTINPSFNLTEFKAVYADCQLN